MADWAPPAIHFAEARHRSGPTQDALQQVLMLSIDCERGDGVALAKQYDVARYPTFVLLDPQGTVIDYWTGFQERMFVTRLNEGLDSHNPTRTRGSNLMGKGKTYGEVADPWLHHLKHLQSQRLRHTYDDLANIPKYEAACFFFFNRLYSTEDTAERDNAFRGVHKTAKRFLGGDVVASMTRLIELQEITLEMDHRIVDLAKSEGITPDFDIPTYERYYLASDNYQMRERQIELLDFTARLVHRISHRFGIRMVLNGLRAACVVVGDTRLVDFLMDGYRAFADLNEIETLAGAIQHRETQRLKRIFQMPHEETW